MGSALQSHTDVELEREILRLQTRVQRWAQKHCLWLDAGFKPYLEHVKGEPTDPPTVTMLWFEGPLHDVLSGEDRGNLSDEFYELVKSLGYTYENVDGVTLSFHANDPALEASFRSYFHWQWVCSLIQPDFADVHQ
ncbi:MAG: hypothetical protein ACTHPD_11115 [Rhizomicrobium sp.]